MPSDRPSDAQALIARGQSSLDRADYREAVECFSRAIALQPNIPAPYRARAKAYAELGQRTDALNDLDRAVRLTPADVSLLADRALLLYRQHSYDAARADCDRLLARAPDRADILGLRADCFSADGDSDAALADYAAAIEKAAGEPKLAADLLRRRAGLHLDLEDTPSALRDADTALKLDPTQAGAYRVRGLAKRESGDLAGADADLSDALRLDPAAPLTRLARASVRYDLGRSADCVADCDAALKADPDSARAVTLRGMAHRAGGNSAAALADFTRAVKLAPEQPGPRNLRAGVHYQLGQYGRAVQDHLDALKCDPRSPSTFNQLGWVWATAPDPDVRNGKQAKECATRACELTEFQEPGYLDTLAAAHAECGEFEDAEKWQRKAAALVSDAQKADFESRVELYSHRKAYRTTRE